MKILLAASCKNIGTVYKSFLLEYEEIDEVFVAQTIQECIDIFQEKRIDLTAVSSELLKHMPRADALLTASKVHRPKKVVMTPDVSGKLIIEAIRSGFNDVIALSSSVEEMFLRMKMVVDGVTDLSQKSYLQGMRLLLDSNSKTHNANDEIDLQILMYVARGYSNKDIAEAVYLSLQTVRNRISRLMQAMQAENRTQLALMFLQP
jgi:DNA-binding NarL/FixJ family response regulator